MTDQKTEKPESRVVLPVETSGRWLAGASPRPSVSTVRICDTGRHA
jgi:hypothetical protein